jgi:hypothetical protein
MTPHAPTRSPRVKLDRQQVTPVWMLTAIALLCTLCAARVPAQSNPTADDVKAAYLFNFGKFVRYPADQPPRDFDICMLGHDPVERLLELNAIDERVQDRPVRVKRYDKPADARGCSVVYMGSSEAARIEKDLAALEGSNALTVSDLPQFIEHGGMIQFVLKDNRVRFAVNLSPTERARLALSSELLKVALSVSPKPSEEVPR